MGNRDVCLKGGFFFFWFFKNLGAAPNPPAGESRLRNPFSQEPADIQNNLLGLGWAGLTSQQRQRNSGKKKEGREERERKWHKKGHPCLWVLSSNSESNGLEVTPQVQPRSRRHMSSPTSVPILSKVAVRFILLWVFCLHCMRISQVQCFCRPEGGIRLRGSRVTGSCESPTIDIDIHISQTTEMFISMCKRTSWKKDLEANL